MIRSPEQATGEWLTAALHRSGAAPPSARIVGVAASPVGSGKVGRCVRFRLTWSRPDAGPASVIGKFAAADERSRRTGVGSDAYRRESLFYRRLAPLVRIRVPRCHLAELDPVTGGFAVLMSDAAPARPRDQVRGASPDDVVLALEELVRLQAPFWNGAGLSGQDWLPVSDAAGGRRRAAIYRLVVDRFVARFGSRLSPGALAVLERFGEKVRDWAAAARPPFTLVHGDFRLDNLLYGDDTGAAPLTVVDWQTVAVGSAAADPAYLIGGALPAPVRRAREEELYRHYRRCLRATGVTWSERDSRRSYRISTLAGVHMTVVGAMLVRQDPAGDAMFLSLAERHTAHASDLEALDALDHDG